MSQFHRLGVPHLHGIGTVGKRLLDNQFRRSVGCRTMALAVDVGHKQLTAWIVVRFEDDSTAYNIGVTLYQSTTVGEHAIRSVKVSHYLPIDVSCRLFHTKQDIINILYRSIQRFLSIMQRLLS